MTDIVERLRSAHLSSGVGRLMHDAADEIERLQEEVQQTRMRIADLEKQLFRATGRTP